MTKRNETLPPLKRRLLILGKTQGQVARDIGVTPAAMSEYVNGVTKPHPKRIRPLAIAMDMRPDELVDMLNLI